jgi:hypothetical protein
MKYDDLASEDDDFQRFCRFFTKLIDGNDFCHAYYDSDRQELIDFRSFEDAYDKYFFIISREIRDRYGLGDRNGYSENKVVLDALAEKIKAARSSSAAKGQKNEALVEACKELMVWGGTKNGNSRKIDDIEKTIGLDWYLEQVEETAKKCQYPLDTGQSRNFFKAHGCELVSTAGFTKIYSLAFSRFIIYDSRVCAAIGWFCLNYLKSGNKPLPDTLKFSMLPGRGGDNRNPSFHRVRFPSGAPTTLKVGKEQPLTYHKHFDGNMRANKLVQYAVQNSQSKWLSAFGTEADKFRAIESALFMIGYDIPHPCVHGDISWCCPPSKEIRSQEEKEA